MHRHSNAKHEEPPHQSTAPFVATHRTQAASEGSYTRTQLPGGLWCLVIDAITFSVNERLYHACGQILSATTAQPLNGSHRKTRWFLKYWSRTDTLYWR